MSVSGFFSGEAGGNRVQAQSCTGPMCLFPRRHALASWQVDLSHTNVTACRQAGRRSASCALLLCGTSRRRMCERKQPSNPPARLLPKRPPASCCPLVCMSTQPTLRLRLLTPSPPALHSCALPLPSSCRCPFCARTRAAFYHHRPNLAALSSRRPSCSAQCSTTSALRGPTRRYV